MSKSIRVTREFRDISNFATVRSVGDVFTVDDARAAELVRLGLAAPVEEAAQTMFEQSDKAVETSVKTTKRGKRQA